MATKQIRSSSYKLVWMKLLDFPASQRSVLTAILLILITGSAAAAPEPRPNLSVVPITGEKRDPGSQKGSDLNNGLVIAADNKHIFILTRKEVLNTFVNPLVILINKKTKSLDGVNFEPADSFTGLGLTVVRVNNASRFNIKPIEFSLADVHRDQQVYRAFYEKENFKGPKYLEGQILDPDHKIDFLIIDKLSAKHPGGDEQDNRKTTTNTVKTIRHSAPVPDGYRGALTDTYSVPGVGALINTCGQLLGYNLTMQELSSELSANFTRSGEYIAVRSDELLKRMGSEQFQIITTNEPCPRGKADQVAQAKQQEVNKSSPNNTNRPATTAPKDDTDPLLSAGETRFLQLKLIDLGYDPGPKDAQFGPKTAEAIRKFQIENKLPETGSNTESVLNAVTKIWLEQGYGNSQQMTTQPVESQSRTKEKISGAVSQVTESVQQKLQQEQPAQLESSTSEKSSESQETNTSQKPQHSTAEKLGGSTEVPPEESDKLSQEPKKEPVETSWLDDFNNYLGGGLKALLFGIALFGIVLGLWLLWIAFDKRQPRASGYDAGRSNKKSWRFMGATREPNGIPPGKGWSFAGKGQKGEELRLEVNEQKLERNGFLTIGRDDSSNDLVIDDDTVSREHLKILVGSDGLILEDQDSSNGTIVDGRLLNSYEPTPIDDTATVLVGNVMLSVAPAFGSVRGR